MAQPAIGTSFSKPSDAQITYQQGGKQFKKKTIRINQATPSQRC